MAVVMVSAWPTQIGAMPALSPPAPPDPGSPPSDPPSCVLTTMQLPSLHCSPGGQSAFMAHASVLLSGLLSHAETIAIDSTTARMNELDTRTP